nr:MAG TPA: Replicase polyprotein 1ab [Caudoviricetes sp.]
MLIDFRLISVWLLCGLGHNMMLGWGPGMHIGIVGVVRWGG